MTKEIEQFIKDEAERNIPNAPINLSNSEAGAWDIGYTSGKKDGLTAMHIHLSESHEKEIADCLLAFGNHRNYWCTHCGGHVTNGHKEICKIVNIALRTLGKEWTEKNIQVEEWNNYGYIAFDSKLNTNLK